MAQTTMIPTPAGTSPFTGMACMVAAMMLLPLGDTLAKLLTEALHPVEIATGRVIAQAGFLMPAALLLRARLRGPMFSPIVALSGLLVMTTLTSLIAAFAVMPIATAIAIFFVEPLLLTVLAGPLLGEAVGWRRLAAVGVGLLGAVIVMRPGAGFDAAMLLPLLAALAYAVNMIVLRIASRRRSALTIQVGATVYACLGMAVLSALLHWAGLLEPRVATLSGEGWAFLLGSGALAAASYVLIAEAFRHAEAGFLAPFQYLEIIGATAAGYLVFGHFPDGATWTGIAIILASGLYIVHRERVRPASIEPAGHPSRRIKPR
ncbi:DMT family transporter [Wenxinia saemankumensis]|uniref:Threonine/homoserine efflux transporter RhtA n=1 Tax=Wenxinia saemankumensis TaxID=1447782 RepID=A0A1M6DW22_9RHOB|nr:DMT family transporter [Wenxinia saemankumensis]SHI77467.1 Threonine/homoserine efflux transporter RhtA [Wenxinia saemankumensis]